jgi:hypothetical protein
MTPKKKRLLPEPQTPNQLKRRIQRMGFEDALRTAYARDLAPLHDYLRTFLPDQDHADAIITLMERRLRRDFVKEAKTPEWEAAGEVVALAETILHYQRADGRKIGRGGYERAIAHALELLTCDGDIDPAVLDSREEARKKSEEACNNWRIRPDIYKWMLDKVRRGKKKLTKQAAPASSTAAA